MSTPELRKRWRKHYAFLDRIKEWEAICRRIRAEWLKSDQRFLFSGRGPVFPPRPEIPPFPQELWDMT
jgi:hypothetical protein